jgi:hypothetical protein
VNWVPQYPRQESNHPQEVLGFSQKAIHALHKALQLDPNLAEVVMPALPEPVRQAILDLARVGT